MLSVLLVVAAMAPWAAASPEGAPVVSLAEGRVSGIVESSTKGTEFHSYYGIPFAKPPLGELRLKDPVKPEKWTGVRDGSRRPPPCLQVPFGMTVMSIKLPPEELFGDEDCLYLNVFTPKERGQEALPVMVFIHGGGFYSGGAHEYLPHVLMNHDIVLVVLQYRLGLMGFLSTEDEVIPGNFGLKDQTEALRWVQNNIHNFGGDASRVTIFGESAGGGSVHFQMLTPKAKGLFSGVIMHSGSALGAWAVRSNLKDVAVNVSKALGCSGGSESSEILYCLQKADGRKLASGFQDFMIWSILPIFGVPRIDGDYLPDEPAVLMRDGKFSHVNIMAGVTRDDGAMVTQSMLVRDDLLRDLRDNFEVTGPVSLILEPDVSDPVSCSRRIYEHYLGPEMAFDLDHLEQLTRLNSDLFFDVPHDLTTQLHAKVDGLSTYRYELKHRAQLSIGDFYQTDLDIGRNWIPHADDLYYLFAGGPFLVPDFLPDRPKDLQSEEDLRLRDIITTLWTNFAATGNPTPDDALGFTWESSTPDNLHYLALMPSPAMEADHKQKAREFWSTLPLRINKHLAPEKILQDGYSSRQKQDEL